jgi:hypothetical protein
MQQASAAEQALLVFYGKLARADQRRINGNTIQTDAAVVDALQAIH